ncbi:hypothetical protein CK203_090220 [Vitis vinifera]|uniref:DUF4283 domain-containing protein n=1 Tax=Vitis vinifera TaxID=29760 RepID=A0A438CJ10_VITVI|nr:hypothetical protein CK203_090220 [Vitis vinifera]
MDFLKDWAGQVWLLRGKLNISVLGRGLLLFEFELLSETERVLERRMRRVKDNALFLEKWHPEVGCFCNKASANEAWVRVVVSLFIYGAARLLVKVVGRDLPTSVPIVVGRGVSQSSCGGKPHLGSLSGVGGMCQWKGVTVEEEDTGSGSRGVCRGEVLEKEAQSKEQVGVQVEPPCGSSSKDTTGFSSDFAERGFGLEATDGADSIGSKGHATGTAVKRGGFFLGSEDLNGGPVHGRPKLEAALGRRVLSQPLRKPRRALLRAVRAYPIWALGPSWRDLKELGLDPFLRSWRWGKQRRRCKERMRAEASRYEPYFAVFGGERDFFSYTPSSGCDRALVVGDVSGLDVAAKGASNQAPLCAVLSDGNPWVMDSEGEKSIDDKSEAVEEMQDREDSSSIWDESNLLKFSKALGFATEGVEGEILKLLLRLKIRRDQGKKKGSLGLTSAKPRRGEISGVGALNVRGTAGGVLFDHQSNPRLRRVIWNPWKSNGKLKFMKNQALELHSPLQKSFKELKNPMLETVCDSELKRRSYSHCKTITPS